MTDKVDTFRGFVEALEAGLDDPDLTSPTLAARLHLSRSQFDHVVTLLAGEAPGRFRRRVLLERAAYRLAADQAPILDVAIEAGYSSHEAFTRAFVRAYQVTPSRWRAQPGSARIPAPNGAHFCPPSGLKAVVESESTTAGVLLTMVRHHLWLTGELIERSSRLSDSRLDEPIPLPAGSLDGQPSIRALLSRLVGQLEMWNRAVADEPYDLESESGLSHEAMRIRLERAGSEFVRQIEAVSATGRHDWTFVDTLNGSPTVFTFGAMLAHVLTYAAYRRTVLVAALETAGITDNQDVPLAWDPLRPLAPSLP